MHADPIGQLLADTTPSSDALLERARVLIAAAIRRRWGEGLIARDPDGVFTSFLGAEHIERLLAPEARPADFERIDDAPLTSHTSLGRLAARLDLRSSQADLLAVLLACSVDPVAARLIAYLGGNQTQTTTVDLVFECVYRARASLPEGSRLGAAALLHADLAPAGLLRRLNLVLLDGNAQGLSLTQTIRLHPRLSTWLLGDEALDAELSAVATLYPPTSSEGECDPALLAEATATLHPRDRLLLVEGLPGAGRELLLRFAAFGLERSILLVHAHGLSAERVVAAFREAALQGAMLALRDPEHLEGEAALRLRECIVSFPDAIALVSSEPHTAARYTGLRPLNTVSVPVPPQGERERLWVRFLGAQNGLSVEEQRQVAGLYNLGVGGILMASRTARELAAFEARGGDDRVQRRHLSLAVRQLFDADLSSVAHRMEVTQTMDDVVLADDIRESIASIIDRIALRGDVMGGWGFARKLGKGTGLTVLFSGEPGTGKSMVAGLIARELGLDLYVVDLSRITSKWIGETEKNLARAFDAAEAGHVLLLFDEADSVLGKRTADLKTSNDRNANLETNFILARLEQFQGIAFFTTNLASAIDPAVARRLSVHVRFPFPDEVTRIELWQRMIPAEAPVADDIDFEQLAERYELSGGYIRNVVLRAAYLAARADLPIGMEHLETAVSLEYRERGSLLVGGRLV